MVTSATPAMSPISVQEGKKKGYSLQSSHVTRRELTRRRCRLINTSALWCGNAVQTVRGLGAGKASNPLRSLTFLGLLLGRGLGGHVDGGGGHADRAASRDQVQLHRLPGDEGGRHLHVLRQAQVGAEAGHEVAGGDEVHAGLQGLQDELEAAADLLLGNPGHGADLWTGRNRGERYSQRALTTHPESSPASR